ncbi:hypothetical protein COOONC_25652 [Cooperia oncophora]
MRELARLLQREQPMDVDTPSTSNVADFRTAMRQVREGSLPHRAELTRFDQADAEQVAIQREANDRNAEAEQPR